MRKRCAAILAICQFWMLAHAHAEENPALTLASSRVTLDPDDTLEFVLAANVSPLHPPRVSAWLLPAGAPNPEAGAAAAGRAFVAPSPKPGEWLVHVRGLQAARGTWDLFVRWAPAANDPDGANGARGEVRLTGAVSVRAEAADVVLLMDGSLSMGRTDPKRLRVEAAREFIAQARASASVGRIAIVQFDSKSRTLAPLTGVGENFEGILEQIDERGETDIDGGIRHSLPLLSEAGAIVLLTDGKQEPGDYKSAHQEAKKAGIAIHTLALGRDADRELLRRIAADTGGTFSDAAKDRDLTLAYAAIASRIARVRPIVSANTSPLEIPVDGACRSLAVRVGGEQSGTLTVNFPDGQSWSSPAQPAASYFRDAPAAGAWSSAWNGPAERLTASARTALYPQFFRADPSGAGTVVIDTDEPQLTMSLAESAAPMAATKVEAVLAFEGGVSQTLVLNDAGRDGDTVAGDGIFSADLPPFAGGNGAYPENARGTIRLSAEGQREGLKFNRETESAFVFRRHLGAALIAGGALDFGTRFNSDSARLEIPLRVRGPGGALSARLLAPDNATLRDGRKLIALENVPAQLGPRQRATSALNLALGQWQEPGLYGGIVEFELDGTGRARIPWTVRVQTPALQLPKALDLGVLAPGESLQIRFEARVDGGAATVESIELDLPWRARRLPLFEAGVTGRGILSSIDVSIRPVPTPPVRVTQTVTEMALEAAVADDAPGGALHGRLILRDAARRELGSVALNARVASPHLQSQLPLMFGPVEAGDKSGRTLRWALRGKGADNARLPERTRIRLLPDARLPAIPAELLPSASGEEGGARSRLVLTPSPEARAGETGGWLQIECGPVLLQRRWSAFVVQPYLGIEPSALDFGTLAPGQRKVLNAGLTTHAVKPVPVEARVVRALAKPNLPNIRIEENQISFALPGEKRAAGVAVPMGVTLEIPDNAQDGVYTGSLEVASRLGHIALPVRVNVVSPVAVAPFHVSPANVLLRFESADARPPTERLRITSHRDADQTLVLQMQADGTGNCAYLLLDPQSDLAAETLTLSLPARATLDVSVRALPSARAGERSRVLVSGESDQHTVSLLVERPQSAAKLASDEPSRLLNWLLLLLVLLLMLLAYLIRNLIQRRWLRYAVYSLLFHAAFFPLVMPKNTILDALPSSMQITLLEAEASLGMELSEQQMRRLDALQSGEATPPPARKETPLADAVLPAPALPEAKAADAPAKAELEKRIAEEMRAALETLPEPVRAVVHTVNDKPLDAEALRAPEPAPKQPQPVESTVAARAATTLAERFSDAPLPAAPERPRVQPERSAADLPLAALPDVAPLPSASAPAAAQRPAEQRAPAFEDAPLQAEKLPTDTSPRAPVQISERAERVRDLAAQTQSELSSAAAPLLALPLPNTGQAQGVAGNGARAGEVPAASVRGQREGAPMAGSSTGGAASAALARPAGATGNGLSLDGSDAPLDAGPRLGTASRPGNERSSAERGGGEGPRTARGASLTSLKADGPIQELAGTLERSTAIANAGGRAVPRTGSAGLERRVEMGESTGRTQGETAATGTASARPGRDVGTALDGAPLDAGDPGKVALRKAGGETDRKTDADSGRGKAAAQPGHPAQSNGLARMPAAAGPPQIGTSARPGERTTPVLKPLPGLASLDPRPAGGPGGGKLSNSQKGERLMNAPYTGALLKVNIGLAQHGGDWNSSPTALYNLRAAFLERCGLPEVEFKINTVPLSDVKALLRNRTVLVTSNGPIPFKPEELRAMREYMLAGGTLWVNDSSASESNIFDTAFRASIANLLPGAQLEPLPMEHPFFSACYDLRGGFKGYRVPPGDKYRVNYIEALLAADGRAPMIYTRNDYADGLEIDPRMSAGGKSLTDLTNAEMQEASLRFCLNLVAYSMQGTAPKMPPPPEGVAEFEKVYRYSGPELPVLDNFTELLDQWQKPVWLAEKEWCNPTEMQIADEAETKSKVVRIDFKGGAKFKAAVTRNLPADFSATKALVADLHSSLGSGFNVALLFYMKDGRSYETRPVFVRPGWNRNVRFPLDMGDMKSSATNPPWKEYDQPFAPRNNAERVTLLLYNLGESGSLKVGPLRVQKDAPK